MLWFALFLLVPGLALGDTIRDGTEPTCQFFSDSSCSSSLSGEETLKAEQDRDCISKEISVSDNAADVIISSYDTTFIDDEVESFMFYATSSACSGTDFDTYTNIGNCGQLQFNSRDVFVRCEEEELSLLGALLFLLIICLCCLCSPCILLGIIIVVILAIVVALVPLVVIVALVGCVGALAYWSFCSKSETFLHYNAQNADMGLEIETVDYVGGDSTSGISSASEGEVAAPAAREMKAKDEEAEMSNSASSGDGGGYDVAGSSGSSSSYSHFV